jgi:hypothetical protein
MTRALVRYLTLLLVQTACAFVMLDHIRLTFGILIDNTGIRQTMPILPLVQIAAAVVIGQVCYWIRVLSVAPPFAYRNILLGHLFSFAGRLSFIFGGALFSFYFMRHLPAMETVTFDIDLILRLFSLFGILFALYCYSLELERVGLALQLPPPRVTD